MRTYTHPNMTEALSGHFLDCQVGPLQVLRSPDRSDEYSVWKMFKPGTGNYRVQVSFSPEGISIQGDIGLGRTQHGICSAIGYDLSWFSDLKTEDYLCSKFLREEWQVSVALRDLQRGREEAMAEGVDVALWSLLLENFGRDYSNEEDLIREGSNYFSDFSEKKIGYDHPLMDAGWLCAIQRRFSELRSNR